MREKSLCICPMSDVKYLKSDEYGSTSVTVLNGEQAVVKEAFSADGAEILENEYAMLRRLEESGISGFPRAISFSRSEDGTQAKLVRSYIPGISLETLVEGQRERPGLPRDKAISIVLQILTLLASLHALSPPVIHRDIKPQNIIVDDSGQCHIIDMGIARHYSAGAHKDTRFIGTPLTAPPEQFGYRQTDPRSDIYSTGILLAYCLTGSYDSWEKELDRDMLRVVRKASAFDPDSRYRSAEEMARDLRSLLPAARRRHAWKYLAAAVILLLLSVWMLIPQNRPPVFEEPLIEQAVRRLLNQPEGSLTEDQLSRITALHIYGCQPYDDESQIWFLGSQPYMRPDALRNSDLWQTNGGISSLADLKLLPNLRELCLYNQKITEISALRGTAISRLGLGYNPITDISPLKNNDGITYLNLTNLPTDPMGTVSTLHGLRELSLAGVTVDSLSGLAGLPLETLNLYDTWTGQDAVSHGWEPIAEIQTLRKLTVNKLNWHILDVLEASTVTELEVTHANGIPLTALQRIPGLQWFYYYTDEAQTVSAEPLSFPALVWADLKNIRFESLRCLSGCPSLKELLIYASECLDYEGLDQLPALESIYCTASQRQAITERYPDFAWNFP